MSLEQVTYGNWGNCLRLFNEQAELFITLDFGPRVIRFGWIGGQNMFCEDTEVESSASGEDFDAVYGEGKTWYIRGGHRLWTSPEARPRSYYPDNEPVAWEEIENGVLLTPPPQKWTQLQEQMEITMCPKSAKVTVKHKIVNLGAWDIEFAAWALTVLARGGLEIVPQPQKDTVLLGNRLLALWPYTKMTDERVYWGDKYISLQQHPDADHPIKFGINSEHGFAAYCLNDDLFVKKFELHEGADYPDGGMSFETYTNSLMLEMESISPMKKVAPGECIEHTEYWALYSGVTAPDPKDEAAMDALVEAYVK